jgi:xanthine dehydrogenase YagT iron-sulfur-binding subunit
MSDQRRPDGTIDRLSRRGFLTSVGAGAVATAVSCKLPEAPEAAPTPIAGATTGLTEIRLEVNRRTHRLLVEPRWSLLYVLRTELGLTATKEGCGRGECGACTVLIDDQPRYACMVLALEAEGKPVTTLEGLMSGEALGSTQEAFVQSDAFQCGFCTPGQVMAVEGLLHRDAAPDDAAIREGLSGNLCRCGAYPNIIAAAELAARARARQGK